MSQPPASEPHLRIGVVDDHPVIVAGVLAALQAHLPQVQVVATGVTVDELLSGAPPERFDVVVLDLQLGDGTDPADNVARLVALGVPVLVFTQADHLRGVIARCFRAGARGLVTKHEELAVLAQALREVAGGGTHFSPTWAAALESAVEAPELAPREAQALRLYATGIPLKSVARRMGVAEDTAKEYVDRARRKYAATGRPVGSRVDLYVSAVQEGLVQFPSPPPQHPR